MDEYEDYNNERIGIDQWRLARFRMNRPVHQPISTPYKKVFKSVVVSVASGPLAGWNKMGFVEREMTG